jgi:hypothetical protein
MGSGARAWVWVGAVAVRAVLACACLGAAVTTACSSSAGSAPDARDVAADLPSSPCLSADMLTPIDPDADAGVGTCAFALGPPTDPILDRAAIQVYIGDAVVPYDMTRTNGWVYLTADYSSIELFGPACDLLMGKTDGGSDAGLRVLFLCLVANRP